MEIKEVYDAAYDKEHPRNLIPRLCRQFYINGWCTGTGGGVSIRGPDGHIYVAPSGVQKEMLQPEDMFVMDDAGNVLAAPDPERKLRISQCTPLFMNAYRLRGSNAVLHSHSHWACLVTMLYNGPEFRITFLEFLKGIRNDVTQQNFRYDEMLTIPIIENTPFECDLEDRMHIAMQNYPQASAVLVRRHGLYVWGTDWRNAKAQAEAYDYLFRMACDMLQHGIKPWEAPPGEKILGLSDESHDGTTAELAVTNGTGTKNGIQ